MNQYLEELSQKQGVDYRANVPEGTVLGEQQIEPGATAVFKKNKSLLRAGNQALPEREALYDLTRHDVSMVPATIAQARMAKYPGRFTTIKPANWHDADPVPIDDTCVICESDPERIANPDAEKRPKFYSASDLSRHYQLLHSGEWEDIRRDREEAERRADQSMMRGLIASVVGLMNQGKELPVEVREQIEALQDADEKPVRRKRGE